MDLVNSSPFRIASLIWQPRAGAFALTVACKLTFVLTPGSSPIAPTQDEPNLADDYWNDDERRSLQHATDLAPFKRRADVLMTGHAYAPGGNPVRSLSVRLVAGSVDKRIEVRGDRALLPGGRFRRPAGFVKMPLLWERAAGGPGTPNPVGLQTAVLADPRGALPLPNFEGAPGASLREPAGFGPIAPAWPGRVAKLHRHAATWDHRRWNERPLPQDIDAGYFNAAPDDQQAAELHGDERLLLENLHPEHARLSTCFEPIAPRARVESGTRPAQEVRLRCDTLTIDTDRGTASLTWRGFVLLDHPAQRGAIVVTAQPGPRVERPGGAEVDDETLELEFATFAGRSPLPFRGGASVLVNGQGSPRPVDDREDATNETCELDLKALQAARGPLLPFVRGGLSPAAYEPGPLVSATKAPESGPAPVREPAAPPALLGPITAPSAHPPSNETTLAPLAAPTVASPPEITAESVLPLAAYPLERCAQIAASLAREGEPRTVILERAGLAPEVWSRLHSHWREAMDADLQRGKASLVRAYDAAYVGQLEAERGAITVDEYARLAVAAQRGAVQEVLAELGLPRNVMLRVQRVWLARLAESAPLGARVREAIVKAEND